MQVRVAYRMPFRYLSQNPTLPSNQSLTQQASEPQEQRRGQCRRHPRIETRALSIASRMWQGQHNAPKRNSHAKRINSLRELHVNSTQTLRNCKIFNTECHCKHTYVLWGLIYSLIYIYIHTSPNSIQCFVRVAVCCELQLHPVTGPHLVGCMEEDEDPQRRPQGEHQTVS